MPGEPCLFVNKDSITVFFVFFFVVDDIILLCRPEAISKLHDLRIALMQRYEMRDLGELSWFLGISIIRDRPQRKLWLCQDSHIKEIAASSHLTDRKPPATLLKLVQSGRQATPQEIYLYQRKVMSLLYATTITRPDAARAANKLSEFLMNPSTRHQVVVDRAISYLYGTNSRAIEYSATDINQHAVTCASDAAFHRGPGHQI